MDKELLRRSFNTFLKLYFDTSKKMYEEMDLKELTGKQFRFLRAIEAKKKVTASYLAEHFNLSKPTVSEMIHKFEEKGLIMRERSSDDQRVVFIKLTEHGKILASTNKLESMRMIDKMQKVLTEEEQKTLKQLFDKIGMIEA